MLTLILVKLNSFFVVNCNKGNKTKTLEYNNIKNSDILILSKFENETTFKSINDII